MKLFKEQLLGGHTAIASWLVLPQASPAHRHKDKKGVLGGRALSNHHSWASQEELRG